MFTFTFNGQRPLLVGRQTREYHRNSQNNKVATQFVTSFRPGECWAEGIAIPNIKYFVSSIVEGGSKRAANQDIFKTNYFIYKILVMAFIQQCGTRVTSVSPQKKFSKSMNECNHAFKSTKKYVSPWHYLVEPSCSNRDEACHMLSLRTFCSVHEIVVIVLAHYKYYIISSISWSCWA